MANRVMEQKRRKMLRHRLKGAKKVFPSHYNNYIGVGQGPDVRIGEYFSHAQGLKDNTFVDRPAHKPKPPPTELEKLFQVKEGRLQHLHQYHHVNLWQAERYRCYYYFGGGEHFFVQDIPKENIRRVSIVFNSKDEAFRNLELYHNRKDFWE